MRKTILAQPPNVEWKSISRSSRTCRPENRSGISACVNFSATGYIIDLGRTAVYLYPTLFIRERAIIACPGAIMLIIIVMSSTLTFGDINSIYSIYPRSLSILPNKKYRYHDKKSKEKLSKPMCIDCSRTFEFAEVFSSISFLVASCELQGSSRYT